jgi:hypothetical protein
MNKIKNDTFFLFCLFLAIIVFHWGWLNYPFFGDSYRLLTASVNPNSFNFNYLLDRITNTTSGYQYRPISFFSYFYLMRIIFGLTPVIFHLASMMFFLMTVFFIFQLLKTITKDSIFSYLIIIFYCFHPVQFLILKDATMPLKYFVPIGILALTLNWTISGKLNTTSKIVGSIALLFFSIGCHEASFLFPIILWGAKEAWNVKWRKSLYLIFLPSLMYVLARLFLFGVPSKSSTDIMSVDLSVIPQNISYYWTIVWGVGSYETKATDGNHLFVIIFYSLLLVLSCYTYYKDKDKKHFFSLFMSILLILPFTALRKHIYFSRASWDLLGAIISFSLIITYFYNISQKTIIRRLIIVFSLIFFLRITLLSYDTKKQVSNEVQLKIDHSRLINEVGKIVAISPANSFIVLAPQFELSRTWSVGQLFPGLLALNYPNSKFYIKLNDLDDDVIVTDGSFFKKRNNLCMDPYYHLSDIHGACPTNEEIKKLRGIQGVTIQIPQFF